MRTLFIAAVLAIPFFTACGASAPPVTVVRVGKTVANPEGATDRVSTRRVPTDATYAGIRGGTFIARSEDDWGLLWKPGTAPPKFPASSSGEMVVVVASDDPNVSKIKVRRVVETGQLMTVFVRETILGEGCVRKPEERVGSDAVTMARTEKPVKFFIEDEDDASCGGLPKAEVACHVTSAPAPSAPSAALAATAGDVAECELRASTTGKYALVDQQLTLVEAPPGSNAKLAFAKGSAKATLPLDTFGTFLLRADATDEAGRKGKSTTRIEVVPKKAREALVQVTWADMEVVDGSEPRVVLRAAQEGPRGQRCSAEVPVPGLCDAKSRGPFTSMKIPASKRTVALSVLYLDDKAANAATPCVNVWFDGERTMEACDKEARRAEGKWELGVLDTATGKITPPAAPAAPAPAAPAPAPAPAAKQ